MALGGGAAERPERVARPLRPPATSEHPHGPARHHRPRHHRRGLHAAPERARGHPPGAPSAAHAPRRLRPDSVTGADLPVALAARSAVPDRPGAAFALTPDAPLVHGAHGSACGDSRALAPDRGVPCAPLACRKKCVGSASLPRNCPTTQWVSDQIRPLRRSEASPCVAFASQTGAPGPARTCDRGRRPSQLRRWRSRHASRDSRAHGVDRGRSAIAPSEAHSIRTGQFPLAHPPLRNR